MWWRCSGRKKKKEVKKKRKDGKRGGWGHRSLDANACPLVAAYVRRFLERKS